MNTNADKKIKVIIGGSIQLEDLRQIAKELSVTASAIGMRTDDAIAHQLIASIQVLLKEVQS